MTPILETPRLILRPFAPSDWPAVNALVSDPEATRYMHFVHWTKDQRRHWFDQCIATVHEAEPEAFNWVIMCREADDVIGWFGIGNASPPTVRDERSFRYVLTPAFWNQGYITEALRAVRGTPQVSATCEIANAASSRVMEKVGMRREETVYDADFEGNWAYRHHYAITRAGYGAAH